jgi:uncharacterized protein
MTATLALTNREARRLSVIGQLLSSPRAASVLEVVRGLGELQMDPTAAVARTEQLVLFSRLGSRFRVAELERLLWRERALFEYNAHILPTEDYWIHRETMRRYPAGAFSRHAYVRDWLAANAAFRRYVLRELRTRGPLRTRDLEDRVAEGWHTGGWNDQGRNTTMMLELLWSRGEVMIVGRDGNQRLWDLAERRLPTDQPRRPAAERTRTLLERQLRARGVERRGRFGAAMDGERPAGWERALRGLVREGVAVPATIDGYPGEWYAHADVLSRAFRPRTVLLSPFDDLISDRDRTERLFGFRFRLEIYVPKAQREYGYFVLPILHGDRLIGRIDPRFDRATQVLHVHAVHAEPDAPSGAGGAVARSLRELATWLGATEIRYGRRPPAIWRASLED